jgi:16S rRNA (cytidine1402-2'-O)-methyltransferase
VASSAGTLYLVATPIGNLEDVTLRALRVLREVALIAAEDTRRTRILLDHYGIPGRLISFHAHNERRRIPELLRHLQGGASVALVSDAGTPGISDPGTALVNAAAQSGIPVVPIPGPSAFLAALVASGLPTVPVTFLGFLPRARKERASVLRTAGQLPHTLVLFEAPHRLVETLQELFDAWGDRRVAVAREMTKVHEEVFRGRLAETLQHFAARKPQGEFTLVVEGAASSGPPHSGRDGAPHREAQEVARAILSEALEKGIPPVTAVRKAAEGSGLRRNQVYKLWLAMKKEAAG